MRVVAVLGAVEGTKCDLVIYIMQLPFTDLDAYILAFSQARAVCLSDFLISWVLRLTRKSRLHHSIHRTYFFTIWRHSW